MSYNILSSNGSPILINDNEIDRRFSPSLIGNSTTEYVSDFSQTMLQLCENYSSIDPPNTNPFVNFNNEDDISTNPRSPITGQLWYDFFNKELKVYSVAGDWDKVGADGKSGDLVPQFDSELNVGSEKLYWDTIYATQAIFNTNNYLNQEGVGNPDNRPAITVDGDIILGGGEGHENRMNFESEYEMGEISNPFSLSVSKTIKLGLSDKCGLEIEKKSTIVPSSIINDAGVVDVSMGADGMPINKTNAKIFHLSELIPLTSNNILLSAEEIIPESNNTVSVGSASNKIENIYTENIAPDVISNYGTGFNATEEIIKKICSEGFKELPDSSISSENSTPKIIINRDGDVYKTDYTSFLPTGSILMWALGEEEIPSGWHICDGSTKNGLTTPNLIDRFVLGAKSLEDVSGTGESNELSSTYAESLTKSTGQGGSHKHNGNETSYYTLTDSELPAHTHDIEKQRGTKGKGGDSNKKGSNEIVEVDSGPSSTGLERNGHKHDMQSGFDHSHLITLSQHDHKISLDELPRYKIVYVMKVI
jgi:hypothetical protein